MSDLPTISIVTPSFNQGDFLAQNLTSVQAQSGVRIEHIVIDGGSTDDSVQVIERYANGLAYWQSQSDKGQTDALIQGFDRASGEIFGWLNSDDYLWDSDAMLRVAEAFARRPEVDIVTGDLVYVSRDRRPIMIDMVWKPTARQLRHYMAIAQPSTFWRRKAYERAGGLNPELEFCMDFDLFQRMSQDARLLRIPHILAAFRLQPASKTYTMQEVQIREQRECRRRMTGRPAPGLSGKMVGAGIRLGALLAEGDALLRRRPLPCLMNARIEPMRARALKRAGLQI